MHATQIKPYMSATSKQLAKKKRQASVGAIPTTEIIAEEGEDENAENVQSGGGTIHSRLYNLGKSLDRSR